MNIELEDLEIQGLIGEGAFGLVHKGKWQGRKVAIKSVKKTEHFGEELLAEIDAIM